MGEFNQKICREHLLLIKGLRKQSKEKKNLTEMFSLFYGLWKYIFSKTEFHVLILGIDKAGKTVICLLLFCTLSFPS